jgi:phosphoribosylformylglycinamidine cyclo-ligase
MMTRKLTYSDTGVDRDRRAESKKALQTLTRTYSNSRYGKVVELPFGRVFPFDDHYLDLVIEGVGTKVLLAQLAGKYSTIGIDGVAMAVNDVIRSGAKPLAVADNIHAQVSDPFLVQEWMKGIVKGAEESECVVPSGEIGDVADLIKGLREGKGFDMVFASIGEVFKDKVITGKGIRPGDSIIGLRSSGIHSNGISLARRVLFKQWGGRYEPDDVPDGLTKEIVHEVLEPTRIYVKPFLRLAAELELKGAVHITGDAYLKFGRFTQFSKGIGFDFDNFKPQPVFNVIRETASKLKTPITDEEMFKTFNMGWGFAVIVNKTDSDKAVDILEKTEQGSEQIGHVSNREGIRILCKNKRIILR